MRTLKLATLFLALGLVFGSTSCKYTEGPGISLRTKKARVAGEWTIEKSTDSTGKETTGEVGEVGLYTFDKDGTGTANISESGLTFNLPFTWEFVENKEKLKVTLSIFGQTEVEESTIVRLTNKEMWLREDNGAQLNLKAK